MTTYRSLNHTKWHCQYHVVFIPNYRKKAIYGGLREQLGEVLRQLALHRESRVEDGHLLVDHVHMLVSIPPKYSVAQVGRLHDQRRAPVVADPGAEIQPERVVGADTSVRRWRVDELLKRGGTGLRGRRRRRGQCLSLAEPLGPFERRRGPEVPDALQIRTPCPVAGSAPSTTIAMPARSNKFDRWFIFRPLSLLRFPFYNARSNRGARAEARRQSRSLQQPVVKPRVTPKLVMGQADKARRVRIQAVCDRGATSSGGIQRQLNGAGLSPRLLVPNVVAQVRLHSDTAASRPAALLVGRILPVCFLLAPCWTGASAPEIRRGLVQLGTSAPPSRRRRGA